jgi:1L-myo-inositol 1-phosphate cytidylyltransferase / CDP-L-myo-inositol myo-inositolphosphotransferase
MTTKPALAILFASAEAAETIVAGIPAAARAVLHGSAQASGQRIVLVVPGNWQPSPLVWQEAARLAPHAPWDYAPLADSHAWIGGENVQMPLAEGATSVVADRTQATAATAASLRDCSRRIIAATGKAGDGIVSRLLNRPVSQAITGLVLRWHGARPGHATLAAGLIGIAMLAALLLGGEQGLPAGAVLFQLASIVDGVDGEIARATFRSSRRGAMLDTLTDAATNLGFFGGLACNLWLAGDSHAAAAGVCGTAAIATGNLLLGRIARRDTKGFSFDTLKHRLRERPSKLKQTLIWIGSRDFYALAACLATLAGGGAFVLYAFGLGAGGWLIMLGWTLGRPASRQPL